MKNNPISAAPSAAQQALNLQLIEAVRNPSGERYESGLTRNISGLLTRGADVNARDSYGFTALMAAAGNGRTETRIVAGLLNKGADINAEASDGSTALMIAAEHGHAETVLALLSHDGIKVNAARSNGFTALMLATLYGCTKTVLALLSRDEINVNAATSFGLTALMIAAENGHTEIVLALLSHDRIDVNAVTPLGFTALMIAAQNGHTEIVSTLLSRDKINVGLTALGLAFANGHFGIASKLNGFRSEANFKAKTSNDSKALIIAALNGRTEIVSNLLLRQDINVNAALDGVTALMFAAGNGHTEIVSTLLSQGGIDVDAKTSDGSTALTIAARSGQAEAVSALLSRNDVDWKKVRDQLSHPALLSDNEALFLLAATIPNQELRNSIIASFNEKNPYNKIKQEDNDILGAGPEMYNKIKDLKSCYKRYLTFTSTSLDENEAENLANLRFLHLFNDRINIRQEALARDNLVTDLVSKLGLSDTNFAEFTKSQGYLDALSRLKPEDLHKLTTEIIDNSKAANGGEPTPKVLGLVAELRKGQINTPASSIETRRTKPGEPIKATKNQIPSFSI